MTRPAPRIHLEEIVAGIWLDPNGAHQLEVGSPANIVSMKFTRNQVPLLKAAIAEFERQIISEDGRSGPDRTRTKFIPIEA